MAVIFKNDWQELLENEFEKTYYQQLRQTLVEEYRARTIYPNKHDIFNALHYTAYKDIKVVILGQDPYHGPGQAHGLCFSVQPQIPAPPSLGNIYKELKTDLNCTIPNNGYLVKWAEQGVLLLNTVLTVRASEPNSHKKLGWTTFTDHIITLLNQRPEPMVFILWGRNAQDKKAFITNPAHLILESVHPSPLSASRGFLGSKPFSKTNAFLKENGLDPIDWQIENI